MFDLKKRTAASVGIEALASTHIRFFADENGMPKLKDSQGNLVDFRGPQGIQGETGPQGATGATGATGAKGWSPVLAVVTDGERRVLQVADWVGGEGTKPASGQFIGSTGFVATAAQAVDIRGAQGATGATGATGPAANAFNVIAVAGQNNVVAEQANDTLTLVAGANISITTNDVTDSVTISSTAVAQNTFAVVTGNTGTATADAPSDTLAITGGTGISTAATDTPDGLVITNTGVTSVAAGTGIGVSAATGGVTISNTGVTSVNGQTGAVTVPTSPAVTRTAPTASASTVLTTVQSFPLTGGATVAGHEYEFEASLRVINTTTATNLVVTLSVGATNVLVLTQANGTTAAASPGAPVFIRGRLTFSSATSAEAFIHAGKSQAVAYNAVLNTSAPVTVVTAANTTIDLKVNTSGTTATFICRQATIRKV
jgi:hypothetical protein